MKMLITTDKGKTIVEFRNIGFKDIMITHKKLGFSNITSLQLLRYLQIDIKMLRQLGYLTVSSTGTTSISMTILYHKNCEQIRK